ncbi:uncharacterized protein LOC9649939 [Selaginella moellendorffii]|nr:uncharacterized protein LOC9649939 [Selaginella moellendorffii]|eukprot:XP_002976821.2 uncharacterized protein LOC9649939 [Selaginella moellendorffii]
MRRAIKRRLEWMAHRTTVSSSKPKPFTAFTSVQDHPQQLERSFFTASLAAFPRSRAVPALNPKFKSVDVSSGKEESMPEKREESDEDGAPSLTSGGQDEEKLVDDEVPLAKSEEEEILEEGISFEKIEEEAKRAVEPMPSVIILGRPNVGKSSLYNRLVHRKEAIVYDTPDSHVTRDIREGSAKLSDLRFKVFDSAGLETSEEGETVLARTTGLTATFLRTCHAALFLIDGRAGVSPLDKEAVMWFRKLNLNLPVVLVVNKAEKITGDHQIMANIAESYSLGLGDPVPVSAETGEGLADLFQRLQPILDAAKEKLVDEEEEEEKSLGGQKPLRLAIAGRTNVGKSTVINSLLRKERVLTGPEPGLTRDAITIDFEFNKKPVRLVDTAGWIQRSQLEEGPMALSAMLARRSLMTAHVVAIVLDAQEIAQSKMTLRNSEAALARWVTDEGRALIIVVNKMDVLKGQKNADLRKKLMEAVPKEIQLTLPQVLGVPIIFVSALKGRGRSTIMKLAFEAYDKWCTRVSTPRLNRWLHKVLARHPKRKDEKRAKPRYITQVKARPPTFVLFVAGFYSLEDHELRFISNAIREDFNMGGIPVRVIQRTKKELEGV